ncbi:metalloendopeptidase [Altericroceibacterium spongiae]|uniref:Metalloendopeptidase n=1 Tax=Altericroceibacterium spongiae TaxID=2320269 RepID=A0A420EEN9_9SPHN|nr:peptidoglycan DD-metalloendopeptidase family protein [Altericroceibacterium spongiae]RKF19128.1 metalloendopeptidase [Altericroceibacterium spongiae]
MWAISAIGQNTESHNVSGSLREDLQRALAEQDAAQKRSAQFEEKAQKSKAEADKAANRMAALAAHIQQAEAGRAAAQARSALIGRERRRLDARLAEKQRPIVQLTSALQQIGRRPVALSVLQPGSVKDMVYLRAMLSAAMPRIHDQTSDLRSEIAHSRALRREAEDAARLLKAQEDRLLKRRQSLAALELRQRDAAEQAKGSASREANRALALGERARDLDMLVGELDRAGALRRRLAALPGPVLRPAHPSQARSPAQTAPPFEQAALSAPKPYMLPVDGRLVSGFGAMGDAGRARNLTLAPHEGAQIVAPAAGRVGFAGPYQGYGRIVIIEHAGGWTSVVTGLGRTAVQVGDRVRAGMPLGTAPSGHDRHISVELRRDGEAVNPLRFVSR